MTAIKKLLVVFKSHLDIGFTDFSANIRKRYLEEYIPAALQTARQMRESGGKDRFVWTTGSWLIYEYVKSLDAAGLKEFSEAVKAGDIRWHALPFTTHTELMDKELFEAGLGITKELDELFGVKTIAAKMTDVPGHTKAIVPLLANAGVEFLHIGVNPASAVPKVPPICRWRANDGSEVTLIYNDDYGKCTVLGNSGIALCFAHAGDNHCPPPPESISNYMNELREQYPGAEIVASDLNSVAEILRENIADFPVVSKEIGDSWIRGGATDPHKMSMFRSLMRYRRELDDKTLRKEINRRMIMIPEHTWGLDEKTHLQDRTHFEKNAFNSVRATERYKKMEKSWDEQRDYINDTLSLLSGKELDKAQMMTGEYRRIPSVTDRSVLIDPDADIELEGYTLKFGRDGSIIKLSKGDTQLADADHRLAQWGYTQFGPEDYVKYFEQYIRLDLEWVHEDCSKIGMESGVEKRHTYKPKLIALYHNGHSVTACIEFPIEANKLYGCPSRLETEVSVTKAGEVVIDAAWWEKPANRMAEEINLAFAPIGKGLEISKLGEWIVPDCVTNGSQNLHATDYGVKFDKLIIESLDAPVLSIGQSALINYQNRKFSRDKVLFNLYNNTWGTNFPMWYDEDARFRFVLKPQK